MTDFSPEDSASGSTVQRPDGFYLGPLIVPVGLRDIRDPDPERASKKFADVRRVCMARGRLTCIGCGFTDVQTSARLAGFMDVHHINHDPRDYSVDNLAPICPLCADIVRLGLPSASDHERGEVLVGDVLDQEGIVTLCRTLMVACHHDGSYSQAARDLHAELRAHLWASTRSVLPEGYDGRPASFSLFMQSADFAECVSGSASSLTAVRYLPALDAYPEATAFWSAHVFAGLPEAEWHHYTNPQ